MWHRTTHGIAALGVALMSMTTSGDVLYDIDTTGWLPDEDPAIPTDPGSSGNAINASAHVAGGSTISGGCIEVQPNVFECELVLPRAMRSIDGVVEPLGVLGKDPGPGQPGRPTAIAWGINDSDWIVGEATVQSDGFFHAFLWLPEPAMGLDAGMQELPQLDINSKAYDVNNDFVIVGESRPPDEPGAHAAKWTLVDGEYEITDLGLLGGLFSIARGVNNAEQVVGEASMPGNEITSFIHLPEPAYGLPAGLNDLTPDVEGDRAHDINNLGQVVGRANGLPMIWLPEPALGLPAGVSTIPGNEIAPPVVLEQLGAEFLLNAEFLAINNNGDAVGRAQFAFPLPTGGLSFGFRGIVWTGGEVHVLQLVIPEDSGWQRIINGRDINDAGQITGLGVNPDGNGVGYVMTPIFTCPADLNATGEVGVDDLLIVLANWGTNNAGADLAEPNDVVDVADLLQLLAAWGPCS